MISNWATAESTYTESHSFVVEFLRLAFPKALIQIPFLRPVTWIHLRFDRPMTNWPRCFFRLPLDTPKYLITARFSTLRGRCRMHSLVDYFQESQNRTAIYHEVVIAYLDWIQRRGFTRVCLWVSPPPRGTDFIFWCHPKRQKTPNRPKLLGWYLALLG